MEFILGLYLFSIPFTSGFQTQETANHMVTEFPAQVRSDKKDA